MKLAWRRLAAAPGVSIAIVCTIALGFGATLAAFGVIDALLLQSLPVRAPAELVHVHSRGSLGDTDIADSATFAYDRGRRDLFSAVTWETGVSDTHIVAQGLSWPVRVDTIAPDFLPVLGVAPILGGAAVDSSTGSSGIVLDFNLWTRSFQQDANVIGQTVTVGDRPFTVVGVTPRTFFGITAGDRPDAYVITSASAPNWVRIVARLAPGRTPLEVESALAKTFTQVAGQSLPEVERRQNMLEPVVSPLAYGLSDRRDPLVRPVWALSTMALLLMVIAASNVAGVLVARQTARRREIAVELALGATRWSVVAEMLWEAVVVAGLGCLVGGGVATTLSRWLSSTLASTYGITLADEPISRLAWAAGAGLALMAVIAGAALLFSRSRSDLVTDLRGRPGSGGGSSRVGQSVLLAAQVGASVTLVATASLFLHSLANLDWAPTGFDRDGVAVVSLVDHARARTPAEASVLVDRLTESIRQMPGTAKVALAPLAPFSGAMIGINISTDLDAPAVVAKSVKAFFISVTPSYFDTLGIKVESGRRFMPSDDGDTPAIVLTATLARRLFGNAVPEGHQVRFVEGQRRPMTVVGVVSDSKYLDLREEPVSFAYLPWPKQRATLQRASLLVRATSPNLPELIARMRPIIRGLDPQLTIASETTLATLVTDSVRIDRAVAWLCSVLGGLALAIVGVGLWGVLSAMVERRKHEMGVRLALGATTIDIVAVLARTVGALTAGGLVLGAIGATVARALVASQLFHVARFDYVTGASVTLTVVAVGLLAFANPIRAALRTNPLDVLRDS